MTSPSKAGPKPAVTSAFKQYKLAIPMPRQRYSDADRVAVTALWLAGFSASSISRTYGFRKSQILGIVHRSGFEMRSTMNDDQRQEALTVLFDFSTEHQRAMLPNFDWAIRPLEDGRKRRPGRREARTL